MKWINKYKEWFSSGAGRVFFRKHIIIFGAILMFIGILIDFCVILIGNYISVDPSFILYVYAALATIAALSGTVLTIIISSFSTKYYGFTIREMLSFENLEIKVSNIIPISLVVTFVATIFLAFDFITTIVLTLFYIIVLIICYSNYIWEISTNDLKCKQIVKAELVKILHSKDNEKIIKSLNNLFDSFLFSVEQKSVDISNDIMELIKSILENIDLDNKELETFIDQKINYVFLYTVPIIGYSSAIEKVLSIHDTVSINFSSFDKRRSLLKPIKKLKFCNDENFSESIIYNTLEYTKFLNADEKKFILCNYFTCILLNQILTLSYKYELIEDFFAHITNFSWSEDSEYDLVRHEVILHITKKYILTNDDDNIRTKLFTTITNQLYGDGFGNCAKYFETLVLLYQSLYFYSFYEIDTLKVQHREKLKKLIDMNVESIDTKKVTFIGLLNRHTEEIVSYLLNIVIKHGTDYTFFEYFPKNFGAKNSVWTEPARLKFAFRTYLLFYYDCDSFPHKMINDWDTIDIDVKELVVSTFLSCFDDNTRHLNENTLSDLIELSDWIGEKYSNNYIFIQNLYDELNNQMKSLNLKKVIMLDTTLPKLEALNKALTTQISDNKKMFGYDPDISITGEDEITFKPIIEEFKYCYNEMNIAANICKYVKSQLNSIAKKNLPMIQLSFDKNGVIRLLNLLKKKTINSRNYDFVYDSALSNETRALPEYTILVEKIKNIKCYRTQQFNSNMFFNKEYMRFNVIVSKYSTDFLNENQCDEYSEKFKVADGFYKIQSALYNKAQAMEIIHKLYKIQYISLKLRTNISDKSGFVIGFNHKQNNKNNVK
jgi:hypothetical protein